MRKQTYVSFVMFLALILSGRGLWAQGSNSCTGVSLGSPSFGVCSVVSLCSPGTCIPWTDSCAESDQNSCQGTPPSPNQACSATITKSNHYMAGFPDSAVIGTSQSDLVSNGVALTAQSCTENGVGFPFAYGECWPEFGDPAVSDGLYSVNAWNEVAITSYLVCDISAPRLLGAVSFLAGFRCSTGSVFSSVNAKHQCCSGLCSGGGGPDSCLGKSDRSTLANNFGGEHRLLNCNNTPIVVDVTGNGYELTDLAHGVAFNLTGQGAQRISWTDPKHGNAWLALDRNGNGVIDDGSELFGNFTPQPTVPGVSPNGFLALAVYDLPANGGNGNGMIDPGDAVWSRLRLWIDSNQNGVSEPGELHTLDEFEIAGIDLDYHVVNVKDKYGNQFHYRGRIIEQEKNNTHKRTIWDVLLIHQP